MEGKKINAEKRRLTAFYKDMPEDKKGIASGLIERAAFMKVSLFDLENDLKENGWTEDFAQGNQESYKRARPEANLYNSLNANYQKIMKQLDAMLPKVEFKPKSDGFDEFTAGREDD